MSHQIVARISACILAALAGNAAASPCLPQPANAAMVADCGNEQPVSLTDEGTGGLKIKPRSEHQDKFGEIGKYGFAGPGRHDQPARLEIPAQPPASKSNARNEEPM